MLLHEHRRAYWLAHSYIVYKFCYPCCSNSYIGKTERSFCERINEHAFNDKNSVVYNHINDCDGVKYLVDLFKHWPCTNRTWQIR